MLSNQRHLFQLPDDSVYLNCAYMSPLLSSVEAAGLQGMARKRNPVLIRPDDFFTGAEQVRSTYAGIINTTPERIAIIPAASYGLMAAINNLPPQKGTHAITVSDEFPSGYYALQRWCRQHAKTLKVIAPPAHREGRGKQWNEQLLAAINEDTAAVVLSSVHWSDGTLFDLDQIGERCASVGAWFIVDGTQSVGALPINVQRFRISALVCAAYKWLLGPYSIGLAYYSPLYDEGIPLEESWLNKPNAADFSGLTAYVDGYKPGAARYNMGEFSNFIEVPMLQAALQQVAAWHVEAVQQYCTALSAPLVECLRNNDCRVEEDAYRAGHLFGFTLPEQYAAAALMQHLKEQQVYVSLRGNSIRVSPHVYNTDAEIAKCIDVIDGFLQRR